MRASTVRAGIVLLLISTAAACATAEPPAAGVQPSPAAGERIRVRLDEQPREVEGAVEPQLLRGSLVGMTADTVLLRLHPAAGVTAIARDGIDRLDISRGVRSRLESAAVTGAAFGATGALQRVLFATIDPDRFEDETTWESAAIGAAAGAIIGVVAGALFPREQWERVRGW